jgi:hypothetical protein
MIQLPSMLSAAAAGHLAAGHRAAGHLAAARAVLGRATSPADRARLAHVLAQSAALRRPRPPQGSYLRDLVEGLLERIFAAISPGAWGLPGWAARLFAFTLLALALGLAGAALWRGWRSRRAAAVPSTADLAVAAAGGPGGEAAWDAAAWRRQRDLALSQGQLALALRATWWWLARLLAGARAEPTWTGRDLLAVAGRDELRPLVAGLDALTYGRRGGDGKGAAAGAGAEQALRQLIGRLEEVLG